MKTVNDLVRVPELNQTMQQMSREMMKAGLIEETMGEMLDDVMDTDDIEEDADAEVDKVSQPPLYSALTAFSAAAVPGQYLAAGQLPLPKHCESWSNVCSVDEHNLLILDRLVSNLVLGKQSAFCDVHPQRTSVANCLSWHATRYLA